MNVLSSTAPMDYSLEEAAAHLVFRRGRVAPSHQPKTESFLAMIEHPMWMMSQRGRVAPSHQLTASQLPVFDSGFFHQLLAFHSWLRSFWAVLFPCLSLMKAPLRMLSRSGKWRKVSNRHKLQLQGLRHASGKGYLRLKLFGLRADWLRCNSSLDFWTPSFEVQVFLRWRLF